MISAAPIYHNINQSVSAIESEDSNVLSDSLNGMNDEEIDEEAGVDWDAAQGALLELMDRRRYGLADVHVEAMALAFPRPAMKSHEIILRAVCTTLDSIDCQFSVKTTHNEAFNRFLHEYVGSDDDLCRPQQLALGVLAASIVNMLFDDSSSDISRKRPVRDASS